MKLALLSKLNRFPRSSAGGSRIGLDLRKPACGRFPMGRFVTPRAFAGLLEDAGFGEIFIARQTLGIAHIVGSRRIAEIEEDSRRGSGRDP